MHLSGGFHVQELKALLIHGMNRHQQISFKC